MSENTNVENTSVNTETGSTDVSVQNEGAAQSHDVPKTETIQTAQNDKAQQAVEQASQAVQPPEIHKDADNSDENNNIASQKAKDLAQKVRDYIKETSAKKQTKLAQSLVKYDNEKYLQNQEFKNLFKAAYAALGDNLDAEKFVSLVDNYVNSRITAYQNVKNMESENESATDKMQFQSGQSQKSEVLPRMQDIAPDELNEYIYKYI